MIEQIKTIYKDYYNENQSVIEKNIKNYDHDDIEALLKYRDDMIKYSFPLSMVQNIIMEEINNES